MEKVQATPTRALNNKAQSRHAEKIHKGFGRQSAQILAVLT
jgi:hypothetical protein